MGSRVLVPLGDGRIVSLDATTGEPCASTDAGVPITAPLAPAGGLCLAAGVDGTLRAVALDALLHGS